MSKKKTKQTKKSKTKKRKRGGGRVSTSTVESLTKDLAELISSHEDAEWQSAKSDFNNYHRIQQRELKKKRLTEEAKAKLLSELPRYQVGYALWFQRKNLEQRLKGLKKAGTDGDNQEVPSQPPLPIDIEPPPLPTHLPDIAPPPSLPPSSPDVAEPSVSVLDIQVPAIPIGERNVYDTVTDDEYSCFYCVFCYTKHAARQGHREYLETPFLIQDNMGNVVNPVSILRGDDNYDTAIQYCFETESDLGDHYMNVHLNNVDRMNRMSEMDDPQVSYSSLCV